MPAILLIVHESPHINDFDFRAFISLRNRIIPLDQWDILFVCIELFLK